RARKAVEHDLGLVALGVQEKDLAAHLVDGNHSARALFVGHGCMCSCGEEVVVAAAGESPTNKLNSLCVKRSLAAALSCKGYFAQCQTGIHCTGPKNGHFGALSNLRWAMQHTEGV